MAKEYKELEIILSDFVCDKNCPYCTAKITRWDSVEDNIDLLELNVGQLKELGYRFHYVTIGGNGEPTLHSYNKLKALVEMFSDYDIPVKRVLTSGNVFRPEEREKWELFTKNGWYFEVTTVFFDNDKDRKILGYNHNYFNTDVFKESKVRLNYVMLEENKDIWWKDIQSFAETYPNIEVLGLKLLNTNTKTGKNDNRYSDWIVKNAVAKTNRQEIKDFLDSELQYENYLYDTHTWALNKNQRVYFSWKKSDYGYADLVWYGDRFVDYQLNTVDLDLVPKVYIASRFIKEGDSFENDFRTKLVGDITNYNNQSFITNKEGTITYQYVAPFYNEKASDGKLTSTVCEEVVHTESKAIENADVFVCYLDEEVSPGSITELMLALQLEKKIIVFYKNECNVKYEIKSSNWYPITFIEQKSKKATIISVKTEQEIIHYLQNSNRTRDLKQKGVL